VGGDSTLRAHGAPQRGHQIWQLLDAHQQLLDAYQAGLRAVVQDAVQIGDHDGWAPVELLCEFLAGWYHHPEWSALRTLMTAAPAVGVEDPQAAYGLIERRREARALLGRLVEAAGAHDATALGDRVQVIVDGCGVAAAHGDVDAAARTLRTLLAGIWADQGMVPMEAGATSDRSATASRSAGAPTPLRSPGQVQLDPVWLLAAATPVLPGLSGGWPG
jgi:hypothetical protein